MKSQSDSKQPLIQSLQGGLIISWNHLQKERTDIGEVHAYWECEQVLLNGMPMKKNIIAAIITEKQKDFNEQKVATLQVFRDQQVIEFTNEIEAWKTNNPFPETDLEQKAYWLELADYQTKLEESQKVALDEFEASLILPDYTQEATQVATDVINFLNE